MQTEGGTSTFWDTVCGLSEAVRAYLHFSFFFSAQQFVPVTLFTLEIMRVSVFVRVRVCARETPCRPQMAMLSLLTSPDQ